MTSVVVGLALYAVFSFARVWREIGAETRGYLKALDDVQRELWRTKFTSSGLTPADVVEHLRMKRELGL